MRKEHDGRWRWRWSQGAESERAGTTSEEEIGGCGISKLVLCWAGRANKETTAVLIAEFPDDEKRAGAEVNRGPRVSERAGWLTDDDEHKDEDEDERRYRTVTSFPETK